MPNNLLQPTIARAVWSSVVLVQGFVPLLSWLPASGRAMAAEQGRYASSETQEEMMLTDEDNDSGKSPSWWFGGCTRMKNTCVATKMECPQVKKLESKGICMKESIQCRVPRPLLQNFCHNLQYIFTVLGCYP